MLNPEHIIDPNYEVVHISLTHEDDPFVNQYPWFCFSQGLYFGKFVICSREDALAIRILDEKSFICDFELRRSLYNNLHCQPIRT